MKAKLGERAKAIALRKAGYTYNEIAEKLKISKGTCSLWLKNVKLDKVAQERINKRKLAAHVLGRATALNNRLEKYGAIRQRAIKNLKTLKFNKSMGKVFCSLLYWSEGEKSSRSVAFMNSDPEMITFFLYLLRSCFEVNEDKFRAQLHLHSYHDRNRQVAYWSNLTKIPPERFYVYRKKNSGKNKKIGYPGCISIRYYDVRLYTEIESFYKELAKSFFVVKNQ